MFSCLVKRKDGCPEWHGLNAQVLSRLPITAERRKVGARAPKAGALEISATGEVGYGLTGAAFRW